MCHIREREKKTDWLIDGFSAIITSQVIRDKTIDWVIDFNAMSTTCVISESPQKRKKTDWLIGGFYAIGAVIKEKTIDWLIDWLIDFNALSTT